VPKPRAPSDAAAAATCSVGGSLVGFGVSVSCSDSIGDGSTWSGDISASAGLAFAVDASIHPGLPPSVDVSASMQVSAAASGSASATAAADLNVVVPMGERRLAPIDIQLGPVPVVIEPIFNAQLHVTGHLEATFQALGNVSGGFGVAYNSGSGFTTTHGFGGSGNGTYNASASATARAAFEPSITAAFYGDEDIGVFATLSPYVQMDADQCIVKGKSGVDLTLGLKLSVFGHNVLDASTTIPVIENELYNVAWRNCALWSGTINFSAQVHFDSGGAANSRQTRDEHSSSSGHIEWSNSSPPVYDIYPFQTSGSGAEVYKQNTNCGTGNPPPVVTNTTTTNWAGDVNSYGSPLTLSITPADGTHTKWVASTQGPGNTKMPATQTYKYWGYDANGYCKQYTDHPQIGEWPQDIFGVIDQGQVTDSFIFTLPAGQATSSGTRKVTPVANSNQPTVTVSWSLTKTCTQGGTSC
jgi:hypothetical protein